MYWPLVFLQMRYALNIHDSHVWMDVCQGEYDPQQNVTLIDNHRGGYHISYVLHPNAVRCCDYLYRI